MGQWRGTLENVGMSTAPSPSFWAGKRVLITGHSGFKGSWLVLMLRQLGAQVAGISLPPHTKPSLFSLADLSKDCDSHFIDIRDRDLLARRVADADPEIVLHLAAQPLVRASYRDPVATFATNIMGTVHLLDSLRPLLRCRVAIVVTSDKVYENREWPWPYRESGALGGHDPYSASKAASELVTASYRRAFFQGQGLAVATARAGNVIGGGDWSEDRLIPDAIRAWQQNKPLVVRNPASVRPWQHVLEPLTGYLVLAEALWRQPDLAQAWNFGPDPCNTVLVRTLIDKALACWGAGSVEYAPEAGPHEARHLSLETTKTTTLLNLVPRWTLSETVSRTINWYRQLDDGQSARGLCEADLTAWEACL